MFLQIYSIFGSMSTIKTISAYIVDDDKDSRSHLQLIINEFLPGTMEVLGLAEAPEKALKEVPKTNPDILFLDIEMPNISGLDLARQLQEKGYHGKIVFVTGHGEYMLKAIRAKAFDFILKPFCIDDINELVKRYLEEVRQPFNKNLIKSMNITEREVELLYLLAEGKTSHEIAGVMNLSNHTVDTHRRKILNKTGCRNMIEVLNLLRN